MLTRRVPLSRIRAYRPSGATGDAAPLAAGDWAVALSVVESSSAAAPTAVAMARTRRCPFMGPPPFRRPLRVYGGTLPAAADVVPRGSAADNRRRPDVARDERHMESAMRASCPGM